MADWSIEHSLPPPCSAPSRRLLLLLALFLFLFPPSLSLFYYRVARSFLSFVSIPAKASIRRRPRSRFPVVAIPIRIREQIQFGPAFLVVFPFLSIGSVTWPRSFVASVQSRGRIVTWPEQVQLRRWGSFASDIFHSLSDSSEVNSRVRTLELWERHYTDWIEERV